MNCDGECPVNLPVSAGDFAHNYQLVIADSKGNMECVLESAPLLETEL